MEQYFQSIQIEYNLFANLDSFILKKKNADTRVYERKKQIIEEYKDVA